MSNTCIEDGESCSEFDRSRICCSERCNQTVRGASRGTCHPNPDRKPKPKLSPQGCLLDDEQCKFNDTMVYCCSTHCLQFPGAALGYCRTKPGGSSNATAIDENSTNGGGAGLGIGLTVAFIVIVALLVGIIVLLKKTQRNMLTQADIYRFLRGAQGQGHTGYDELPIHEKIDSIPYDASFEIPSTKFTIANQILGSGQFGIVRKGTVKLLPNAAEVPVAVKTTADGVEVRYVKALLSELKLMIYIGTNENIVTLLATCTAELKKGRAYLFLEYCSLGSLENFLRKMKHTFTSIGNNSRPYANDPSQDTEQPLTSVDLYAWSTQIARGLEFISHKKVIHGDLATRNVLLSSRSVAKISDFGLSRRVYDYTNYVKKHQEPLPWKWMAIESLEELTFSTQSDVWGFGVTVWEIFSLGTTPYPGLTWTTNFVQELKNGLQLPFPQFGNQKVYDLLLDCWQLTPTQRPRPDTIVKTLTGMNSIL